MVVPLKNIRIFIQQNWNLRRKIMAILFPVFLIFTSTLEMENSILDCLSTTILLHFMSLGSCFYGSIGAEFLRISRATSKIEDLSHNCKRLLSWMLKQNGQMRRIKFCLIKMIQQHQVFINYNKLIEEVMHATGF